MEQATSTTRNVAVVVLALFGPLVVSLLVTGSGHVNVSRALRHAAALDGKIRGRVLAASTGKPLRRARIVVTGSEL